jgi:hypothetical protein
MGSSFGLIIDRDICRFSNDEAGTGFVTGRTPKFCLLTDS